MDPTREGDREQGADRSGEPELTREVARLAEEPGGDRLALYRALVQGRLVLRGPDPARWTLQNPETGQRGLAAFLSRDEAERFWGSLTPGTSVELVELAGPGAASAALTVGNLVIQPHGPAITAGRAELRQLAEGEAPGDFAAWIRQWGRLERTPAEVVSRFRRAHVYVLSGQAADGAARLYLLEKSDDGTQAVPCFSDPGTLAQFAQVRRIATEGTGAGAYRVALYHGRECLRVAAGLGAFVLIDPESPWETQIDPPLIAPPPLA